MTYTELKEKIDISEETDCTQVTLHTLTGKAYIF